MKETSTSPSSKCVAQMVDQQEEGEKQHPTRHQSHHQHQHVSNSSRSDIVEHGEHDNVHAATAGVSKNHHNRNKNSSTSVIVHGVRYVRPYLQFQQYSIRLHHEGMSIVDVLSTVFDRAHCSSEETKQYFTAQILEGRIEYKKTPTKVNTHQQQHQQHQKQWERPQFEVIKDPTFAVSKNGKLRMLRHIHERCTIGSPIHEIPICAATSSRCFAVDKSTSVPTLKSKRRSRIGQEKEQLFRAVFKPAGLPVIGGGGETSSRTGADRNGSSSRIDSSSLQGLMRQDGGWYAGHRIDLPVSGIVLFGKGKGRAKTITQQLAPDMKQQQHQHRKVSNGKETGSGGGNGFVKAYLARVHGRPRLRESNIEPDEKRPKLCTESGGPGMSSSSASGIGSSTIITNKKVQVNCQLIWDSRRRKSLVVGIDDHVEFDTNDRDGRGTVRCTKNDTTNGISLVSKREWEEFIDPNNNNASVSNQSRNGAATNSSSAASTNSPRKAFSSKTKRDTTTFIQLIEYDQPTDTSFVRVELLTGARQQIRAVLGTLLGTPIVGDTTYGGHDFEEFHNSTRKNDPTTTTTSEPQSSSSNIRLYRDNQDGTLRKMLEDEYQPWCDKCRWQLECCRSTSTNTTTTTKPSADTSTTTTTGGVVDTSDPKEEQQEQQGGGTTLGVKSLTHQICLLSYQYRIPSLDIDAVVPDHMIPDWARTNSIIRAGDAEYVP